MESHLPEFLADKTMPRRIGSVRMTAFARSSDSEVPTSVHVPLSPTWTSLCVSSSDEIQAMSLFLAIDRELKLCRQGYAWFSWLLTTMLGDFITTMFLWFPVSIAFLFVAKPFFRGIKPTADRSTLLTLVVSLSATAVALLLTHLLGKAFPRVRFCGRYHDFSSRPRKVLIFLASSVVLPIALRLLYEAFRHG